VLVVGAGGLGCEALKNLVLSGFKDITVVDMDTIDVSNLNRQFLFRKKDTNRFKAEVAAEFIMRRRPGVKITPLTGKIQSYGPQWLASFDVVISSLDNIEARLWINEALVNAVRYKEAQGPFPPDLKLPNSIPVKNADRDTIVQCIDGGTEGWNGHARVMFPGYTACMQCMAADGEGASDAPQDPKAVHAHLCTLANVPRTPEHCIMYAQILLWPRLRRFTNADDFELADETQDDCNVSDIPLDKDNEEHMMWIWKRACERAREYSITEPSYFMTLQVVKNIIPAISSTNALISAACVQEAFKFVTCSSQILDNYFLYTGDHYTTGVNCQTYKYRRIEDCKACSPRRLFVLDGTEVLNDLVSALNHEYKFDRVSIMDLYETNPVKAQVYLAVSQTDQALLQKSIREVLSPKRVYQAVGPGQTPMKFEVVYRS